MRALSKILMIVMFVTGCGGGSEDARPGPLSKRFDEMHVAQVGMDQKQAMLAAQQDWQVGRAENQKAEADYNQTTQQLTIVRNDREKAKLQVSSAISNKKSAEASSDTNKMNAAQKELRGAELNVKAADARIRYYEAYRAYLKRHWRYTEENMFWREAQYELAKAQIA